MVNSQANEKALPISTQVAPSRLRYACGCSKLFTIRQLMRQKVCKKCGRDLPQPELLKSIA